MELKEYIEKYGKKVVKKILTDLEKNVEHICTVELKKRLAKECKINMKAESI